VRAQQVPLVAGGLVFCAGVARLSSWASGARRWTPAPPIKVSAALCLVLCGAALVLLRAMAKARWRSVGGALAFGCVVVSGLTLCDGLSGGALGIDQLLARGALAQGAPCPGRAAQSSALAVFLCGAGLLLVDSRPRRSLPGSQVLFLAAFGAALLGLLGDLYTVPLFSAAAGDPRPGGIASAAVALLAVGGLCLRPDQGLLRLLRGNSTSAFLLRRLLLVGFVLPLLLGWLRLAGERRGYYDTATGTALMVVVTMAVFAGLIWVSARSLDRTDRARAAAQAKAHESELSMQRLFETGGFGITRFEVSGAITAANETFLSLLGYRREELEDRSLTFAAIAAPGHEPAFSRAAQELQERGVCTPFETEYLRKDGRCVPVLAGGALHQPGGATGIGFVIDLSAQKREEAALRLLSSASAALSASLQPEEVVEKVVQLAVPALADWCLIDLLDGDGRVVRAAAVCAAPEDAPLADALRADPSALTGGCAPTQALASGRAVLCAPMVPRDLEQAARASPHARALEAMEISTGVCAPLLSRGHEIGVLTLLTSTRSGRSFARADLPLVEEIARRAAVALDNARLYRSSELASRVKDEFVATVSHELRTPLHAMLGWVRLLRSGQLAPEKRERALETVERNARVQVQLVEDLLDVSRIISGKLSLEVAPVELSALAEGVVESMRPGAEQRGLCLRAQIEPEAAVRGDPNRLSQVLGNLLGNSIKFTPPGGHVDLLLRSDGGWVEVVVRDDGQGIPAQFLPHAFERFRQAGGTGARRQGGLGLGLAIVRELVELHGGTVRADSDGEGKGALFAVRLPRSTEASEGLAAARGAPSPDVTCPPELRGLRVLVVEDERDTRELIIAALERCSVRVSAAASSAEAFGQLRVAPPDLIVSDIAMPGEDGYSFIRRVRALPADEGGSAPALAITAGAAPSDRARALGAGFQSYLAKPVGPTELLAAIAALAPVANRP
jgi:PAS domain S-box-containing protein